MLIKDKISLITPTYNRAYTIHRVYESLQKQTYKNFEWIIIDDGSTDDTKKIIEEYINKKEFTIKYYQQKNQHKFITIFKGIELSEGEYIGLLDSDDALLDNALEKLYKEIKKLPKDHKYFGVTALSQDIRGNLVGDQFPFSPLDTFIFEMRYKYKVKGDKWGIGFKKVYQELQLDLKYYENKGFIPETVYQYQFDKLGYKTRFINEFVRIYIIDELDKESLSNNFYSDKNAFGLVENYKTFINTYANRVFSYPYPYIKNLAGYIIYGIKDKRTYKRMYNEIDSFFVRILFTFFYPLFIILKIKY